MSEQNVVMSPHIEKVKEALLLNPNLVLVAFEKGLITKNEWRELYCFSPEVVPNAQFPCKQENPPCVEGESCNRPFIACLRHYCATVSPANPEARSNAMQINMQVNPMPGLSVSIQVNANENEKKPISKADIRAAVASAYQSALVAIGES